MTTAHAFGTHVWVPPVCCIGEVTGIRHDEHGLVLRVRLDDGTGREVAARPQHVERIGPEHRQAAEQAQRELDAIVAEGRP